MVTKEEREYNISIDCMCSHCGAYADIIIPNKIKLCKECYSKQSSNSGSEK